MENTDNTTEIPPHTTSQKGVSPNINKNQEKKVFGLVGQKEFVPYVGAMIYGCIENVRTLGFHPPEDVNLYPSGILPRATTTRAPEGIKMLFDQNTGDGTIVSLGFIGADILLLMTDKVARKLGKKGLDPTTRFLSSLTFGIALATHLETTDFLNNTVDIPGDLFGVALGAAFILTSKIASDRITREKIEKSFNKARIFTETRFSKLKNFSDKLTTKLNEAEEIDDPAIDDLSEEFLVLIDKDYKTEDKSTNPAVTY